MKLGKGHAARPDVTQYDHMAEIRTSVGVVMGEEVRASLLVGVGCT